MKIGLIDGVLLGILAIIFIVMVGVQGYIYGYQKAKYTENDMIVVHKNCSGNGNNIVKGGE